MSRIVPYCMGMAARDACTCTDGSEYITRSEWRARAEAAEAEVERLSATAGRMQADRAQAEAETERAWGERDALAARLAASIDAGHLDRQREWSARTFGPAEVRGPLGPLAHIRKELDEIAAEPYDVEEWVDVIILAFDGAWRAGHEPDEILTAVKAKQSKNEARTWPDWRGTPGDEAIEHVRAALEEGR